MMSNQAAEARFERVEPYLRPAQVEDLRDEMQTIEQTLSAPSFVQNQIQDRGAMRKHYVRMRAQMENDAPQPYSEAERDAAAEREAELAETIKRGMPTHAEMRRNPSGAVDKHRGWESRNKANIQEWKNIRLRMHATGMIDGPRDASDIANVEILRPQRSAQEGAMHGEQIVGKTISLPSGQVRSQNHASPEQRAETKAKFGDK
jgi:hypothetical protein